jgi:hypothetical protein
MKDPTGVLAVLTYYIAKKTQLNVIKDMSARYYPTGP